MAGDNERGWEELGLEEVAMSVDRFENCIVTDIAFSACYLRILHNCTLFRGFTTDIN